MKRPEYQRLAALLSVPFSAWPHLELLAKRFRVSVDTVYSIYSQLVQVRVTKTHHLLKDGAATTAERYLAGDDLLELCYGLDLPPCLVLRQVLPLLPLGLTRQNVSTVLKDPQQLRRLRPPAAASSRAAPPAGADRQHPAHDPSPPAAQGAISGTTTVAAAADGQTPDPPPTAPDIPNMTATPSAPQPSSTDASDSSQRPGAPHQHSVSAPAATGVLADARAGDPASHRPAPAAVRAPQPPPARRLEPGGFRALAARLARDVARCVEADRVYSPASDAARHAVGLEYEARLCKHLNEAEIAYESEDSLRTKGFFKTPDAKLRVPVAVRGAVVNWIDSKATFGDERQHQQHCADQFRKYVNRYGPGLVIYWFGFIEELHGADDGILLSSTFPAAAGLTLLPCLPLPHDDKLALASRMQSFDV